MHWIVLLYAALPAFLGNAAPIVVDRLGMLRKLAVPLDGGRMLWGKRLLGETKTVRGLLVGSAVGALVGVVQYGVWALPVGGLGAHMLFGFLGGCGALVGDAVKSFCKRQLGIGSSRPWIPFDYLDYMVGFVVATYGLYAWEVRDMVFLVGVSVVINPITNVTGYMLGIKKTYW